MTRKPDSLLWPISQRQNLQPTPTGGAQFLLDIAPLRIFSKNFLEYTEIAQILPGGQLKNNDEDFQKFLGLDSVMNSKYY